MLLLYRMQAERATGHPEKPLESIERFTAQPAAIDGWRGWHQAMAHMQLGDLQVESETFSAPARYLDLPTADDRANVARSGRWLLNAGVRSSRPPSSRDSPGALSKRATTSSPSTRS